MAIKRDYKDNDLKQRYKDRVKRQTLTKVSVSNEEKRTRAELLDMIEELFEGQKRILDFTDLRAILHMLVKSATNSSDDSVGATQQQIDAINANTAKTGITETQAKNIQDNNLKNSISTSQANAIIANTAKTTFPGFGTTSGKALEGDTTTISSTQASAITANTAKVSQGLTTANTTMTFEVKGNTKSGYNLNIIVNCDDGRTRTFTTSLK